MLPQAETEDPSNEVTEDVAEEATEEAPSVEAPGVPESKAGSEPSTVADVPLAGTWQCPDCDSLNLSMHLFCMRQGCGARRTLVQQFKPGDWVCSLCGGTTTTIPSVVGHIARQCGLNREIGFAPGTTITTKPAKRRATRTHAANRSRSSVADLVSQFRRLAWGAPAWRGASKSDPE